MSPTPEQKFKNKSRASKRNWSKVDAKERSKRMSVLAKKRQAAMSDEEKKAQAFKMVKARQHNSNE